MNLNPNLKIDWCSYKAAKMAVMRWHYSKRMPVFKQNFLGVWENNKFIGAVIFGLGAAGSCNGAQYGLARNFEVVELTRVALSQHTTPVTRIIAICIKMLRRKNPKLQMIVSFADSSQGHYGIIYQGGGWIYTGFYDSSGDCYLVNGKKEHAKTLHSRFGKGGQSIPWLRANIDPKAQRIKGKPKFRYLMPLNSEIKNKILKLAKPYPKCAESMKVMQSPHQEKEGEAVSTSALHNLET